ncbi:MAG: hypothetical protein Q7R33_04385 [Nitrosarchaeum sp.]|nr:hypothetical protein [Nitrosarchaeum sp.]
MSAKSNNEFIKAIMFKSTAVGITFAIALAVCVAYIADAWVESKHPLTDPIAQRIKQVNTHDLHYGKIVEEIIKQTRDTVIIYRDTCK